MKLIREYFNKKRENAKHKYERSKKFAECNVHQNRSKHQKREVDYLEMNVGKCRAQPRKKLPPKKINIVAALRDPSETRLAAHRIQEDCCNYKPGQILGVVIKTEVKTEIKQEHEKINTRHKYKGMTLWGKPNYIHPDGTPCNRALREESQLPDLPDVSENLPLGLQVATGFQSEHTDDANVTQWGLWSDTSNQPKSQDTPSNHQNNEKSMNCHTTVADEIGKMTETAPNNIQGTDIDMNTSTNRNQDTDDGL